MEPESKFEKWAKITPEIVHKEWTKRGYCTYEVLAKHFEVSKNLIATRLSKHKQFNK